jgi:hypothetical protein
VEGSDKHQHKKGGEKKDGAQDKCGLGPFYGVVSIVHRVCLRWLCFERWPSQTLKLFFFFFFKFPNLTLNSINFLKKNQTSLPDLIFGSQVS